MARIQKVVDVCDRCAFGKEKDATTTRRFSVEGNALILKLCEPHGQMFDRDMIGWERLAAEDQFHATIKVSRSEAYFTEDERERARRTAVLREQQQHQDEETRRETEALKLEQENWNLRVTAARAAQADRPNPLVMKWTVTEHARERMNERGYQLDDVLECAEHPMHTFPADPTKHGSDARVYQREHDFVVVVPNRHVIITVLPKDARLYKPTPQLERIAQ